MKNFKKLLSVVLALCMLMSIVPTMASAALVNDDGELVVSNYYDAGLAAGSSTNGHYHVTGIAVINENESYVVLAIDKSGLKTIDGIAIGPTSLGNPAEEVYTDGSTLTIIIPNTTPKEETDGAFGYILIPIGKYGTMGQRITMDIETSAPGWDIDGMIIEVYLDYAITKTVDKNTATNGDTLTYTVEIKNTGDHGIAGINVYDYLPDGLTVVGKYDTNTDSEGNERLILKVGETLAVNDSKSYTVTATVDTDFMGGTITNTAIMESSVLIPKEASVSTNVNAYFYVQHSAGELDKILFNKALRDGNKFDITAEGGSVGAVKADGTTYGGLTENTLYGGTFEDSYEPDAEGNITVYDFDDGESGIGFTPEVNETYYVWEPSDRHLIPAIASVWKPYYEDPNAENAPNQYADTYRVTNAYFLTAVDREYYEEVGFIDKSSTDTVYKFVEIHSGKNSPYSVTANSLYGAPESSLLACISGNSYTRFVKYDEEFEVIPYWVTLDGVQVTGNYKFTNVKYIGEGTTEEYKKLANTPAANDATCVDFSIEEYVAQPLMLARSFFAVSTETDIPETPAEPEENTITITINGNETVEVEPGDISDEINYADVDGMIFAGWYEDSEYTVPAYLTDVQEDMEIYAKYVSDAYLNVQIPASKGNGKINKLSLVSAVDSEDYAEVGFVYVINGEEFVVTADYVKSVKGSKITDLFSDLDTAALFTTALNIKGLEEGTDIEITPYWVTNDGTTVYGTTRTLTYNGRSIEG